MAESSRIEWCDHTFNPWIGCTKVSPGCKNCYAAVDTFARRERSHGRELWGPHAERHRTAADYWRKPLKWNKQQWWQCTICGARWNEANGVGCGHCAIDDYDNAEHTRQRVFCGSLMDVFEENGKLEEWRIDLFKLIDETPDLDWLLLTKRPENVMKMVPEGWQKELPRNIWIGTSVENQKRANERIPVLQKIPAKVRFLSCEPLIDYVDLSAAVDPDEEAWDEVNANWDDDDEPEEFVEECEAECDWVNYGHDLVENPEHREWEQRRRAVAGFKTLKHGAIDWVICGGESGPQARPMSPIWAQLLRDECQQAGIPFFFKQWGAWSPNGDLVAEMPDAPVFVMGEHPMFKVGKKAAGRLLEGGEWNQVPGSMFQVPSGADARPARTDEEE